MTTVSFNARLFLLGYAAGVGVYLLINVLANAVLPGPCAGRTAFALLAPLLLGPGGLAVAMLGFSRRGWGAFGLGLAASSLFPALFLASRDLEHLKALGCAPAVPLPGTNPPPLGR